MKTIFFLLVCYLMGVVCAQVFQVVGSIKLLPIWTHRFLFCKCSIPDLITFIRNTEIATKWISGLTSCQLLQQS